MLGFQPTAGAAGCSLEVEAHIGLEQEFFLVSREAYLTRPDIQVLPSNLYAGPIYSH